MEATPFILYAMYFLLITAGAGILYLVGMAAVYFPKLLYLLASFRRGEQSMVLRCPTCGEKALALLMLKEKSSAPGYRKWGQYGVYECSVCGHREIVK